MALQHLRSSTADKRPTPAAMAEAQLALNTNLASPGLFFKDSNGDLVKVGPVHVGTTAPNATPASGGQSGNSKGEQWLDTSSSRYVFKIWDGSAWRSEDGEFVNASGDTMTGALGIIAGSAASPSVFISGDTNTGIYSPGADQLAISTNGTQRLLIEADGDINIDSGGVFYDATNNRLAIGTTSAGSLLSLKPASGGGIEVQDTGGTARAFATLTGSPDYSAKIKTNNYYLDLEAVQASGGQGHIRFFTGTTTATQRAAIDSSGRLLVGTSTSVTTYRTEIVDDASFNLALVTGSSNSAGNCSFLTLRRSRGSTASPSVVSSGDLTGVIDFRGYSGAASSYVTCAQISAAVDGEPDTGGDTTDMPGRLVFSTTADGSNTPTERMRITSDGKVGIGTTSPDDTLHLVGSTGYGLKNTDGTHIVVLRTVSGGGILKTASNHALVFGTNDTERARITSDGKLGLGTSSPTHDLTIGSTAASDFVLALRGGVGGFLGWDDSANCTILQAPNTRSLQFRVNSDTFSAGTMAMHINSSGNVGIGTTSPSDRLHIVAPNDTAAYLNIEAGSSATALRNAGIYLNAKKITGGTGTSLIEATGDPDGSNGSTLVFSTESSANALVERMRIDSSGRVGIGTANINNRLVISDGSNNNFEFSPGSTNTLLSYDRGGTAYLPIRTRASSHSFANGTTDFATIDSSGRLLVGTSSARTNLNNVGQSARFQLEGASSDTNKALIVSNFNSATDAVPAGLYLARAGSTGVGSTVVVDEDNQLGEVAFLGSDGTDFVQAALIKAEVDGTPGANDMPGRLVFSTTADGSSSPTERMRISANGTVEFKNAIKETVYTLGTSGSIALNPSNGSIQTSVLTGAPTFTDSLEAGQTIVLMLEGGASYSVTWPTTTWVTSAGNVAPTLTAKDTLVFWKVSTTLYGAYVGSYV